jgi:hypothetical protein
MMSENMQLEISEIFSPSANKLNEHKGKLIRLRCYLFDESITEHFFLLIEASCTRFGGLDDFTPINYTRDLWLDSVTDSDQRNKRRIYLKVFHKQKMRYICALRRHISILSEKQVGK